VVTVFSGSEKLTFRYLCQKVLQICELGKRFLKFSEDKNIFYEASWGFLVIMALQNGQNGL
jgi:hypothetical protein